MSTLRALARSETALAATALVSTALVSTATGARAQVPFELWRDAEPRGDVVFAAVQDVRARVELPAFAAAVSTPCARFVHRPLPFSASHEIARPYTGRAPLRSFRVETCVRQAHGQAYENRTPGIPLACSFVDFGTHVRIALDPAGDEILQEFDAFLPDKTYARLGYDGALDYTGVSGGHDQQTNAWREQTIVTVSAEDEFRFRGEFTVYALVTMHQGTILGAGAYTARVDGDGVVLRNADVDGDGFITPGGEPSPNGASIAVVFHWGDDAPAP